MTKIHPLSANSLHTPLDVVVVEVEWHLQLLILLIVVHHSSVGSRSQTLVVMHVTSNALVLRHCVLSKASFADFFVRRRMCHLLLSQADFCSLVTWCTVRTRVWSFACNQISKHLNSIRVAEFEWTGKYGVIDKHRRPNQNVG